MKRKQGRIAIVGMSCWYPGSQSLSELWENVLARRQQFRRMRDERLPLDHYHNPDRNAEDKTYGSEAAFLDGFEFDWQMKRIPKRAYDSTDIVHWLALEVAQRALVDSGIPLAKLQSVQSGVVLGNTLTGEWTRTNAMRMRWPYVEKVIRANSEKHGLEGEALEAFVASVCASYKSVFPEVTEDTLAGGLSNTIAGRICNVLDLHGGGYTVDGACSSSLLAVINAARSLVQGDLDVVFAGGIDISLDTFEMIGFAKTGALTSDEMRVYDKRANGFIPGEGCGFIMMKRLEDAERDGDKIYAVVNGWGLSSDGKGGLTAPSIDGQARAIGKAYEMAGYPLADVRFIEGHGTGTSVGDKVEISALVKVLGEGVPAQRIGLTSLKSIVGHTKAAAGIGGLIKAAIAVNQRVVPPTAGVEEPNQLFSKEARHFLPVMDGERINASKIIRAGVSAMGFGGINTHVTLESYGAPQRHLAPRVSEDLLLASSESSEILIYSAHSQTSLKRLLEAAAKAVRHLSRAELSDYARHLAGQSKQSDAFRAAIVARRPEQAFQAITTISGWLAAPVKEQTVRSAQLDGASLYLGHGVTAPRIALLFPGQGAQKLQMARRLYRRYQWARDKVAAADRIVRQQAGYSLLAQFVADDAEAEARLNQTEVTQPLVTLANALWLEALQRYGIDANVFAGHSLGELAAFHAAGAYDFATLMRLACMRGSLMARNPDRPGSMAYVSCNEQRCAELMAGISGSLAVANVNEPEQTVVGGDLEAVKALVDLAQKQGLRAGMLNVSNAFHTEFMDEAAAKFAEYVATQETTGLTARVVSAMDGSVVEGDVAISEYFGKQLRHRVDFPSLVRAVSVSADVVIEAGPSQILSGLFAKSCGEGKSCLPVESRPGADRDLKAVLAAVFIHGGRIRWDEVYRDRFFNSYASAEEKVFIDNPVERTIKAPAADFAPRKQTVVAGTERPRDLAPVATAAPQPTPVVASAPAVVAAAAAAAPVADPQTVIYKLVADLTGFEVASLQPNLRLLDDLNLDSIKVTELIYRLSSHYSVEERLETAAFTNATIAELATAISAHIPTQTALPAAASSSAESKAVAPAPAQPAPKAAPRGANWVRNFRERMVAVPADAAAAFAWGGRCVNLIGVGSSESDEALLQETAKALRGEGADVTTMVRPENLDRADLSSGQVTVVILPATAEHHQPVVEQMACVARKLFSSGHVLVLAQFDDGFFGQTPGSERLYSAKAFGASIGHERPDVQLRVMSMTQGTTAAQFVRLMTQEIGSKGARITAGFDAEGVRRQQILDVDRPSEYVPRGLALGGSDVVVVTGGAKGITRACAEAMAKAYQCRMAIVGSSRWDDAARADAGHAITQAMASFQGLGVKAEYYACDLTNAEAVAATLGKIRTDLGEPTVLIHGAGLNTPKPAATVLPEAALQEMAPKLEGLRHLLAGLDAKSLKLVGAMTSVIGVVGMPGNAWYAFANEALDLTLRRYSEKTGVPVCSYAYSVWSEIGMGARMGSDKHLAHKGIGAVSPEEGIARFMHLIENRAEDQQTVIASRLGGIAAAAGKRGETFAVDFTANRLYVQPGVEAATSVKLTHKEHPYLLDHVFKGSVLFPTVYGLEAMAQVANLAVGLGAAQSIVVEDIKLPRPIMVGEDGLEIEIWAEVVENTGGATPARIRCGIRTALTGFKVDHFSATFVPETEAVAPAMTFPADARDLGIVPQQHLYGSVLFQGPRFQRLASVHFLESDNETEGRTLFVSRVESDTAARHLLGDPYFRDSLLQSAQIIIPQNQCLPIEIERIRISPRTRSGVERLAFTDVYKSGEKSYLATIEVRDEAGAVLERLENYQLRFLEKRAQLPTAMELIPGGVQMPAAPVTAPATAPAAEAANPLLVPYHPVGELLRIDAEADGPQKQAVFVHRFIPDFKTFSSLSRSIYFPHIFNWMGWAREMSSIPVLDRIRSLTETGKYGLVTNWASIEVLGECRNQHRMVEGRMWCGKMSGEKNSTAVLTFDWVSRGADGVEERIAVGRMGFTWVEIAGHGIVRPAEFPGYYQEFIESMVAKNDEPDVFVQAPEPYRSLDPGSLRFQAPSGPGSSVPLHGKLFETSLYDANLVGNLYFGNYSIWMGKVRDEFFFRLAPELYRGIGEQGELTCVRSRIQHLREAMPFDEIGVTMAMTALRSNSVDLHFEFFKVDPNGSREKLAVASHTAVWTIVGENGERRSAPLPSAIFQGLLEKTGKLLSIVAA